MKRSGNHAVIRWLALHSGRPVIHINNAIVIVTDSWMPPAEEVQYIAERSAGKALAPASGWYGRVRRQTWDLGGTGVYAWDRHGTPTMSEYIFRANDVAYPSLATANLACERTRRIVNDAMRRTGGATRIVISFEDCPFEISRSAVPSDWECVDPAPRDLVIARSPESWLASRVAAGMPIDIDVLIRYRDMLRSALVGDLDILCFDEWFRSPSYRAAFGKRLDLSATCAEALHEVPDFTGGSSFDGTMLTGYAEGMRVLDRTLTEEARAGIGKIGGPIIDILTDLFAEALSAGPEIVRDERAER